MTNALFQVEHLRVAYPRRGSEAIAWAVDDVSFTLNPGEKLGLVGESGCGKSTLGRAAMRLLSEDTQIEGHVTFAGQSVFDLSTAALRRFRGEAVALIFQDPMTRLDPLMTIGDHCLETLQSHQPQLSRRQAKEQAIATLEAVNIPASRWSQYPHEFSGGMRQRVAIALALLLNPKLIVADEPTTSLDVTVSAQILRELTRLCAERQMALLIISHDLAMIGEYCDRIAIMYGGKFVETGATQTVLKQPQHEYTRSLLKAALHLQAVDLEKGEKREERGDKGQKAINLAPDTRHPTPLLHLDNLTQHYTLEQNPIAQLFSKTNQTIKAVDGVSLDLYPGETLGLVGESGCGKSTLSRTILQLIRPTAGKVEFLGQNLVGLARTAMQQQRRQMQMVFQDPHACLNPMMTVGESIADPLRIHQLADPQAAKAQVLEMLERVGLSPATTFYDRYPAQLSGGQQQRVAIARALITRPQLLICDEPVSMLDASVQTQVLALMQDLKDEFNLTYLFITHDLWVARFFCDRIAVMQAGKIIELGATQDLFTRPQHPYTQALLQAAPLLARL
ncbi:ABC transporter, ATP-binding protein (cluster 5, nickel/peptides/opines) / ABC transporter, ATP-binding protein (cluster 5, nickel/peptides/opines) [uncultured Leptolyngbya sp.]|uniref:ABC transporter, ATP-binding protein (Cluster 5, nickel/peptides/opines) / ABC transporter, ATP-binding protein (Cluster 5, nickel/peptides/opines) n=1 Tax=uncultured Leptolyngbya sp. TaxID=332963 RepID=A0A6J4MAF2_9CYAN|nr:ABC transporter, ATP-binding protein (cluster 5, nickel/peptides/opines) / ABC transporter, ATP-binding protein (cluster 5, nickel/peptides/opines) [uncultured Leptolyngbya sp.]